MTTLLDYGAEPEPATSDRLEQASRILRESDLHRRRGRVRDLIGLIIEASGLEAEVGEVCHVETGRGRASIPAEVVGFRAGRTLLMPLGDATGLGPGATVIATGGPLRVPVSNSLLGRTIDGLGRPMDGLGPVEAVRNRPAEAAPPDALQRPRIKDRVSLGVRALDALVPCGRGQRLGIFAGSGVGKSSLLGMIARSTSEDINVICLVGERGREVLEFIERDLGPEGMARSVVVCATSDQPALVRIKAAFTATSIAEYFRDQGHDVMLMMDSVTRFAMAQREIGLAIGEPPATRGYTPSVFAMLPKLLERSGTSPQGSITALYTVLVDGDDMNEPIADAVRSILDGHIVLDRHLAHAGHYPAIDVLASVSRLVGEVTAPEVRQAGNDVRGMMATYRDKEDLISIGAYQAGTDPAADGAIAAHPAITAFLRQRPDERSTAAEADRRLLELAGVEGGVVPPAADPAPVAAAAPAGGATGGPVDGSGMALQNAIPTLSLG